MDFINRLLNSTQEIFQKNLWGVYLSSAIISATLSSVIYIFLDLDQSYSELIVGNISWGYDNKFHDYALLVSIVFSFVAAFLIIGSFLNRLTRVCGQSAADHFYDFLILLCAPAGFWFLGLVTTKNTLLYPLHFSSTLMVITIFFGYLLSFKKDFFEKPREVTKDALICIQEILLLLICSIFSSAALGVLVSRFIPVFQIEHLLKGKYVVGLTFVVFAISLSVITHLMVASKSLEKFRLTVQRLILIFQIPLPFIFLVLVPNPWFVEGKVIHGYSLAPWLVAVVTLCIMAGYWNLFYCYKKSTVIVTKPLNLIPWLSIVGGILFIKAVSLGVPNVPIDDYHFGEMLTPWWSLVEHSAVPFWDYAPARGLINYFQGAFANVFFDGTVGSFRAAIPFIYLGILLISFPVISKTIGKGNATIAFLIAPYVNGLSEIDILVTVFICFLCQKFFTRSPRYWLVSSLLLAIAIILYAPGQGGLAVLAVSPLACIMIHRFYLDFKKSPSQIIPIVIIIIFITLFCFFTPLGKMIFGAIRYALEQSHVNSIANGISWNRSFNVGDSNPWLFEFMRTSWILVTIFAAMLIIKMCGEKSSPSRNILLAYAIPIFIITLLYIIRAAGRIDAGSISRLGIASIWVISLLLPILLFSGDQNKRQGKLILLWVSFAGIISPHFISTQNSLSDMYGKKFNPVYVNASVLKNLSDTKIKFPEMGYAMADPIHMNRLLTIREFLDKVLEKDETYLDVTSRGAQYFYTDRKQPIESGAIYNLVTEPQQLRAIETLKSVKPPAILISGDNILHDGGSASLRSYLMYRYLLLLPNYKVVQTESQVWLIREDRLKRLIGLDIKSQSSINEAPSSLVNSIFRVPDLGDIPASWGRSYANLNKIFHNVHRVSEGRPVSSVNSIAILKNNNYQVTGEDPFVTFDVRDLHLSGKDVGLISFSFTCERGSGPDPKVEFYWSSETLPQTELTVSRFNGKNGNLILPIDATPSWLLTENLQTIRFDIANKDSCKTFTIKNINFLQRNSVSQKKH